MAKNESVNTAAKSQTLDDVDLDNLGGTREIVSRRPMIKWDLLAGRENNNKKFKVAGWLIEAVAMNNPKGSTRQDDHWTAYIVELTHPCKAVIDGDNIVTVEAGKEVYVPAGIELAKQLDGYLGHDEMFWIILGPDGEIDLKNGNRPMRKFKVRAGEVGGEVLGVKVAPRHREGRYLLGGKKTANVIAAPNNATAGELEAARTAVPFS